MKMQHDKAFAQLEKQAGFGFGTIAVGIEHKDIALIRAGNSLVQNAASTARMIATSWIRAHDIDEQILVQDERGELLRKCIACGGYWHAASSRSHRRTCSDGCRQKAYRNRRNATKDAA
jgi:hypothetical protein